MLFNSYIFILLFWPLAVLLYFGFKYANKDTYAKITLILMSFWFYAYFHLGYIFVISASIVFNYIISGIIRKKKNSRLWLVVGILFNIALIFYFKYWDFVFGNINLLLSTRIPMLKVLMPLGISFFTFQQIGFLVDTYNDLIQDHDFIDYALFVSFFPQLIAGPIVSYNEMVPQFNDDTRKAWNWDNVSTGLYWFACGLGKKVLIADNLGRGSDYAYANVALLNGPEAIMTCLLYSFRLYFDFSGYCDMACGIAKIFNIDLPINFRSPLKSLNVMDYWNRWHITLGRFLTSYLFNPMVTACNRKYLSDRSMDRKVKKRRKEIIGECCLFLTFFISGIWHGANWTFILWGVLQGSGRALYQVFKKKYDKWPRACAWSLNFVFNVFSMGLFGAASVKDFGVILRAIPHRWNEGFSEAFVKCFDLPILVEIEERIGGVCQIYNWFNGTNMVLFLGLAMLIAFGTKNIYERERKYNITELIFCVAVMVLSVLSLSNVATFLYFNF